jgi:magnesium transporter
MLRKLEIIDRKLVESEAAGANVLLFIAPDEAELRHLCDGLRIDSHTLTSALDPEELGRVELEPDHLALIIKRPKQYQSEDNFFFKIGSVGMFLFADKLILIVAEDTLRFEGRQFLQVHSLQDVALKVIYRSIHHFREHLRVFSMIADELEQKINRAMENRQLLNLFTLEKSLVYYLNAISSNGRVIEKLKAYAPRINLSTENIEYLDDVMIENAQCHEMATTYSHVLASLAGARVSVVSNNLNVLMKTLTLVMIAIMLPTLVISIFSMNVKLPVEQEAGLVSFWVIMGLAVASAAVVLFLWRYKRW